MAGHYVIYQRMQDYWAKDLPVNKGRHNFDRLRTDYYRDDSVALEGVMRSFPRKVHLRETPAVLGGV